MAGVTAYSVLALGSIGSAAAYENSNRVAYDWDSAIWTADVNGGTGAIQVSPRNTSAGVRRPAISPRGDEVVYDELGHIYIVGVNGQHRRLIYSSPYYPSVNESNDSPHWHPSGNSIVVTHEGPGSSTGRDIYTVSANGGALAPLIAWPGDQAQAAYSSNGQKIVFRSTTSPSGSSLGSSQLFIANADGSGAVQLTKSSGKTAVAGAYAPEFSPGGTQIVFEGEQSTRSGVVEDLYVIGADGTNQKRLMNDAAGNNEPEWSLDGSQIFYTYGGLPWPTYSVRPDGTGNGLYTNGLGWAPKFRQPSTTISADDRLAAQLRPRLLFDSEGEHWRPQNVEYFFSHDPVQVCNDSMCADVNSTADLRLYPNSSYDINVPGSGDASNFTSSEPGCVGPLVWDCGSGPASSIYYHVSQPSPLGYRYLDYWFFYRYNDAQGSFGFDHEADWESVSIAPSATSPDTFDFASFSQHGTWYSYLRGNLSCDGGGAGSCGNESAKYGRRVHSFVSAGTHANYGEPCGSWCTQSNSATPETDHDGGTAWERNGEPQALLAMPPTGSPADPWGIGPAEWTDWPGFWGVDGDRVASPGNQGHFTTPWESNCADGSSCPSQSGSSAPAMMSAQTTAECGNWFGVGVVALVCDPSQLRSSLRSKGLGKRGGVRASLPSGQRTAASAPGIAQVIGQPLAEGEQIDLSSPVGDGAKLYVRFRSDGDLYDAVLSPPGTARGRLSLKIDRTAQAPEVRAVLPGGGAVKADLVRKR